MEPRYPLQLQGLQWHLEPQPSHQSPGQAVVEDEDQEVEALAAEVVLAVEDLAEHLAEGRH